jgi:hypothetical protein
MGKRRGIVGAALVAGIQLCGMALAAPPAAAEHVSWRHNIGTGGRIAVAFAGSVALG